eukprot:5317335-Pleurochrysis_carterae.AAC.2
MEWRISGDETREVLPAWPHYVLPALSPCWKSRRNRGLDTFGLRQPGAANNKSSRSLIKKSFNTAMKQADGRTMGLLTVLTSHVSSPKFCHS